MADDRTDAYRIDTQLIHAGEPSPRIEGAISMPVFQTAMYEFAGEEGYHAVRYIRLNNTPNHLALHAKLARLEGAEAALVTASGMAAISTALLEVLRPGDHLLIQDSLYGGTHGFVTKLLPENGVEVDFIDLDDPASWAEKCKPTTKAIYVEAMTNPLLEVGDLAAAVAFARERGLVSLIDATFASPVNFRAAAFGFDVVLHSATKYLNGHSDVVAGVVCGQAPLVERITRRLDYLGGTLDPHACVLLHRGMKTLALRVRHQNALATTLAEHLAAHPAVARVNYPGLASHPRHARARELFDGCGGVLSFELRGGLDAAERFMKHTRLAVTAPSLGGVETLVTRPATTSHAGIDPEERRRIGIDDGLVRVSVGIEDASDVIADFDRALSA